MVHRLSSTHPDKTKSRTLSRYALANVMALPILPLIGGVSIGVLIGSISGASPAGASTACSGAISNYFDGYEWGDSPSSITGISDNIESQTGALCTPKQFNDFHAAWSMIAGKGDTGYAQSGFVYYQGQESSEFIFGEEATSNESVPYFTYGPSDPAGTTHKFFTEPDGNGGILTGYQNSSGEDEGLVDFTVNQTFAAPWIAETMGEVGHKQSDMPGSSSSRVYFKNTYFEVNGSWEYGNYNAQFGVNQNSADWYLAPAFAYGSDPDPTDFDIYTYNP